ncbi:hypothetical protein [Streptomyces heilongjiangensis]|uniref:DUF8129 domain-containing protein n=1 Tax=Streptomyces heilongjiangensis TaxID=945052 RepID=A0ABW1B8H9_9ACTN
MTDHRTLPLPDYDHLPIGGLESRVRSLTADDVEELLAYERGHADRLPVTQLLTARPDQLHSGAEPTSGDPGALRPEQHGRRSGSPVSPATSPQPMRPPPHGTPDQRGRPKGDRAQGPSDGSPRRREARGPAAPGQARACGGMPCRVDVRKRRPVPCGAPLLVGGAPLPAGGQSSSASPV